MQAQVLINTNTCRDFYSTKIVCRFHHHWCPAENGVILPDLDVHSITHGPCGQIHLIFNGELHVYLKIVCRINCCMGKKHWQKI